MPAVRRARSARAMPGSAALRARVVASSTCLRARPAASVPRLRAPLVRPSTSLRPRPSSCSRSPSTSLVCCRPRDRMPCTSSWASSAVTLPRATASSNTSSIRSRVTITMFSGAIRREVRASLSSATFLPEKSRPRDCASAAGFVAAEAALPACLRAVCCRPRALPPALAARLRPAALPEDEARELPLLRADDPLLRADGDTLRELPLLRDEDDPLREEELRDEEEPPRELALLREDLREDPPPLPDDPPLRDDPPDLDDPPLRPPPDFRSDSAIVSFLLRASVRPGLCHLEACFDGSVIGQPHKRSVRSSHLALLCPQPARRQLDFEAAGQYVIDGVIRGRRRQPVPVAQLGERPRLLARAQVHVPAQHERQVRLPLDAQPGDPQDLLRRTRVVALRGRVHADDAQRRARLRRTQPCPQRRPPLGPPRELHPAHVVDPPRRPHQQLVRPALVGGDQVRVPLGDDRPQKGER